MRNTALWLLGIALTPGVAVAEAPTKAIESAGPGLNVGFKTSPQTEAPTIWSTRQPPRMVGLPYLDFSLEPPTISRRSAQRARGASSAGGEAHGLGGELEAPQEVPELGPISPYVAVNYQTYVNGNDLQLTGALTRSYGLAVMIGDTVLLMSYDRADAPIGGVEPEDLFAAASSRLAPDVGLTFFGMRGLSAGMADLVVGTALTYRFTE